MIAIIEMFNPNKHRKKIEKYLGRHLGYPVKLVRGAQLPKSTREAPWKLTVNAGGMPEAYVLQVDQGTLEYEYYALVAMERVPIPSPKAYGLDLSGSEIGIPCYFSDFVVGEPLLGPIMSGETWAEELYLNSVSELQSVSEDDLVDFARMVKIETAETVLEGAYVDLKKQSWSMADAVYSKLKRTMPELPALRFSNGDLWLENFLVKDRALAGVIDFANACFSDPIYEFLLSFFITPELQGRGMEERYCRKMGFDPAVLPWYHGLEYFDTLRWVLITGEGFVHHTAESLKDNLLKWMEL